MGCQVSGWIFHSEVSCNGLKYTAVNLEAICLEMVLKPRGSRVKRKREMRMIIPWNSKGKSKELKTEVNVS